MTSVLANNKENRKPAFIQRLASGLVDLCMVFLLYWGMYTICMNTPISSGFDQYNIQVADIQDNAKLDTGYGEKVILTPENKEQYVNYYSHIDENDEEYVVVNIKNPSEEITKAYVTKLQNNPVYSAAVFNRRFVLYGINVLSGFVSTAILLFAVPMFNKRRATLGQLAGEISMFSIRFETYPRWYHMLGRYLFIFIFEAALPFMFLELYKFILMPALFLIVGSLTNRGQTLHDLISRVRPIDKKSYVPIVPIEEEQNVKNDQKDA